MEFRIREPGNGVVEIVQYEPVVVGSFPDRGMAEKVLSFLKEDAVPEVEPTECRPASSILPERKTPAPLGNVKPLEPEAAKPAPATRPPSKPPARKLAAVDGVAAEQGEEDWTQTELDDAFARLAKGEKLLDVADVFAKSWTKLRGKWASKKATYQSVALPAPVPAKAQLPAIPREVKSPFEMATTAISELQDQNTCNLCGRHFNITPDNIDTCQRCSNGA